MAVIDGGSSTANRPNVNGNYDLMTSTPNHNTAPTYVGSSVMVVEHDDGSISGTRDLRSPKVTGNNRLTMGADTLLWHGMFPGAAQNTGNWKHLFTTMTAAQTGDGQITLNNNLTATTTTGCSMQTWRHFGFFDVSSVTVVHQLTITNGQPVANQVLEWGLFIPTATAAPGDGVYFRYTSSGLYGYIKFGGNPEVASPLLLAAGSLTLTQSYDFMIVIDERVVNFYREGVPLGGIDIPNGVSNVYQTLSLPLAFQQRNAGAVTGTQMQAKFSCTSVYQNDLPTYKSWGQQMSSIGQTYQGMDGGTMGSLAIYSNAALAAAAALTNTTAAAGNTGLGGAVLVLPTLTAGTDGILFSYQNPAGSVTQPPKNLIVTGVAISSSVQVALTGGPLSLIFGVAFGHTAVSLAQAESASFANNTTKAPRRVLLGTQSYVVTAAAGVGAADINRDFASPITVAPGEFFAITMRNVGTVTSAGALAITAMVDHHFE